MKLPHSVNPYIAVTLPSQAALLAELVGYIAVTLPSQAALFAELVGAFDLDQAGAAAVACAELESSSEIAANITLKLTAAGQASAGENVPAWTELLQSLAQVTACNRMQSEL